MTNINDLPEVSALDINSLISVIKTYVKTKTLFTDYDFEGSNLSMIIRFLAYVAQYDSFNINMVANELKLSTAIIRDNVVSRAKDLGYSPLSYTSSQVSISLTLNNISAYSSIILSAGSVLTSTSGSTLYTFINPSNLVFSNNGSNSLVINPIILYEGLQLSNRFIVDSSNEEQRFIINNNGIDTSSIKVFLFNNISATTSIEYTRATSLTNISNSDTIFFVNEVDDINYEIIFGDNIIGRKLENGEVVVVQYRICNGSAANGLKTFNFVGTLTGISGSTPTILTSSNISSLLINGGESTSGSDLETIQTIKYRAPRYFASNQRAVTISDYVALTPILYPNAELVKVFGGETLNPPEYSKVFIAIKPYNGLFISELEKINLSEEFKRYTLVSVTVEFYDPQIYNINLSVKVIYNKTRTTKTPAQLFSLMQSILANYINTSELFQFGGEFSSSELECLINSLDTSIQTIKIRTTVSLPINLTPIKTSYKLNFDLELLKNVNQNFTLLSEYFVYKCIRYKVYLFSSTNDPRLDKNKIYLKDTLGNILFSVGTINYTTGEIKVTLQSNANSNIKITVIPDSGDFQINSGSYPILNIENIEIVDILQKNLTSNLSEPLLPYSIITNIVDVSGNNCSLSNNQQINNNFGAIIGTISTNNTNVNIAAPLIDIGTIGGVPVVPLIPNTGTPNLNIGNNTNIINSNSGTNSTNLVNSNNTNVINLDSLIPENITC